MPASPARDPLYRGYRFPAQSIRYAVWLYVRFALSHRDVEGLLAERGIRVSDEAIRRWGRTFGHPFADWLRRWRRQSAGAWHLDEVQLKLKGKRYWLWRVVDQDDLVRDIRVQHRRNQRAAARFLRRVLDGEVAAFFRETCGRFPELRFLHYNLPRAGRLLSGRQYAELAAAHPNLVATKYGGADLRLIADLLSEAPRLRHFFTELGYAAGCALGAPGLLVSFASSGLRRARAFFDAGVRRDLPALAALQRELLEVRAALAAAVGPGPHMDGAFDKLISRLQVPDFPLRLLPPYAGAGEAAFERYRAALAARFPAWLDAPPPPRVSEP